MLVVIGALPNIDVVVTVGVAVPDLVLVTGEVAKAGDSTAARSENKSGATFFIVKDFVQVDLECGEILHFGGFLYHAIQRLKAYHQLGKLKTSMARSKHLLALATR